MNLKQFKNHIEKFQDGTTFNFGISEPFAWRGVYAEVAFALTSHIATKEEILTNIELAYTETFVGYKGGDYTYNDYTDVHFEEDYSRWTDGGYCANMIGAIEGKEAIYDQEEKLVKLAFTD